MLIFISSCNKDLGNYDYTEVNKVDTVLGIPDTTVLFNTQLKLKPQVSYTQSQAVENSDFTYEWMYLTATGKEDDKIILSTAKDLDYGVRLTPGTYTIYFTMKSKATGIEQRYPFKLTVVNEINEGWMLLTDVNGTARIDVLSRQQNGVDFVVIQDLLKTTKSQLTLTGSPVNIYGYASGIASGGGFPANFSYAFYVSTTDNGFRLEPNTFAWEPNYTISHETIGGPLKMSAQAVIRNASNRAYMVSDGNLYLYERLSQTRFGPQLNVITGQNQAFKVSPYMASNQATNTAAPLVLFDNTYKRFLKHTGSAASCTEIPDPTTNKLFSFKINKDLLFMTRTLYNGGDVFSVLEDSQTKKRSIARFRLSNSEQTFYEDINAPDFDKAQLFAIDPVYGYIFYAAGSKVYEYDAVKRTAFLMADYGNQKITILRFYPFQNATKYTTEKDLIVCTYDESKPVGEGGKMDIYDVPGLNAQITRKNSYSGFGKVQSLMYRER